MFQPIQHAAPCVVVSLLCLYPTGVGATTPEKQQPTPPLPQAQPAQPGGPLSPPDMSLAVEDYIKLGLPAPDRAWSGADIRSAQDALTTLAAKDLSKLPRYGSPRSGQMFARFVASDENLAQDRDKSIPLGTRFDDALQEVGAGNGITKIYLKAYLQKQTGGAELLELLGGTLRTSVGVFDLADAIVASLDKNAPNYKSRMDGFTQMRTEMAPFVTGCLQFLTEPFDMADRLRYLGYVEATVPALIPRLKPESRQEALVQINKMVSDPKLQGLQAGLKSLQTNVQKAVDKTKSP